MKPEQALQQCKEAFPGMTWEIQDEDSPISIRGVSPDEVLCFEVLIRGTFADISIYAALDQLCLLEEPAVKMAPSLSAALGTVKKLVEAFSKTLQ